MANAFAQERRKAIYNQQLCQLCLALILIHSEVKKVTVVIRFAHPRQCDLVGDQSLVCRDTRITNRLASELIFVVSPRTLVSICFRNGPNCIQMRT